MENKQAFRAQIHKDAKSSLSSWFSKLALDFQR
jgi:hypothetical protein